MLINIDFTIHTDNKPQNLRLIIRKPYICKNSNAYVYT